MCVASVVPRSVQRQGEFLSTPYGKAISESCHRMSQRQAPGARAARPRACVARHRMKQVIAAVFQGLCVSFAGRRYPRLNGSTGQSGNANHPARVFTIHTRRRRPLFTALGVQVKIRFVCASAAAALGFACSSSSFARVVVAYAPVTVVYFPPRPAYYYAPPPAYIVRAVPTVVVPVVATVPALPAVKPAPYRTVVVATPIHYAVAPAQRVVYAQPVMAVPRW